MEIARWSVALVALVTALGGLLADYFLASGAQHIRNPRWPPHAKFHNAQTIVMGALLGTAALVLLFHGKTLTFPELALAAALASMYWIGIFVAPVFPGTAFVDPEFASNHPTIGKAPLQLAIGLVLVGILCLAVLTGFAQK